MSLAAYDVCLPCGTGSAKRRHLAKVETCGTCFPDDTPLATVTPIRGGLADSIRRHPAGKDRT